MQKGTILFHRDFIFKNGARGEKLIITLNEPVNDEPYLCCKTTSQCQYEITTEGCRVDKNIYMIKAKYDCFPDDTWVQFHELYPFTANEFLKVALEDKTCEVKGCLREQTINAIRNCIKKSDDVSPYCWELLFKK